MADILPFRGIRFDAERAGADLTALVAPPYDVISKSEQDALYDLGPHNVVRLILGRETDRYSASAATYKEWLSEGVLAADPAPALYIYRQSFDDPQTGQSAPERIGLVCLLKLEDYSTGKVLPHENTLTAAKSDRLNLLQATQAQFESIYGLFSDPDGAVLGAVKNAASDIVIERIDGPIGSSHQIERITDPAAISLIVDVIKDKQVFIADGHHRYETSLNYQREVRSGSDAPEGSLPADYILMTLTAFEDPGLLVLPTHRLVHNVSAEKIEALEENLGKHFTSSPVSGTSELEDTLLKSASNGTKTIGLALPGKDLQILTLRYSDGEIAGIVPGDQSDAAKKLDVTILQRLVLEGCLGIDAAALAGGGNIAYTRDSAEAVEAVAAGREQAAFILARPTVDEVREVSLAGDKMPQKSTFFYPKLLSGLLLRDLQTDNINESQKLTSH